MKKTLAATLLFAALASTAFAQSRQRITPSPEVMQSLREHQFVLTPRYDGPYVFFIPYDGSRDFLPPMRIEPLGSPFYGASYYGAPSYYSPSYYPAYSYGSPYYSPYYSPYRGYVCASCGLPVYRPSVVTAPVYVTRNTTIILAPVVSRSRHR